MQTVTLSLAIASAVMGGVFFTFSTFVMAALGNLKPAEGIRAMQRINIDVFCWPFSILFFGLPVALSVLGIYSVMHSTQANTGLLLAACGIYLIGSFLLTVFGNVPLNNKLARTDSEAEESVGQWNHYLIYWTRWNHLRTVACVATSILLLLACQ